MYERMVFSVHYSAMPERRGKQYPNLSTSGPYGGDCTAGSKKLAVEYAQTNGHRL
jgi:hypothetical protein